MVFRFCSLFSKILGNGHICRLFNSIRASLISATVPKATGPVGRAVGIVGGVEVFLVETWEVF